jgi:hypothetical protein
MKRGKPGSKGTVTMRENLVHEPVEWLGRQERRRDASEVIVLLDDGRKTEHVREHGSVVHLTT